MQRALAEIALIGLASGALGCWVVLYEFSYAAESLAHSIFPGLVIATLAGVPLLLGAAPAIAIAALAIALAGRVPGVEPRRRRRGRGDDDVRPRGPARPLARLAAGHRDACSSATSSAPATPTCSRPRRSPCSSPSRSALLHGRLLATGFDRAAARSFGLAPAAVDAALLLLLSAAIVVAVQGLGNLLVVAVFVGPAAAARRLTDRIVPMIAIATAIALLAGLAGLYLSYYAGTAGGASVALAIVAAYLLAVALAADAPPPRDPRGYDRLRCPPRPPTPPGPSTPSATLQSAGLRRGGARTAVVEALARHDCAVTALELDDELRAAQAPGSAGPASTGRSSSSSSSASCSGSRSRAAPPATSGSSPAATTTTTRSAAAAGAWSPSRTRRWSGRSTGSPSRCSFEVSDHDVVLRGLCRRCSG